jgi:hypothetical protein
MNKTKIAFVAILIVLIAYSPVYANASFVPLYLMSNALFFITVLGTLFIESLFLRFALRSTRTKSLLASLCMNVVSSLLATIIYVLLGSDVFNDLMFFDTSEIKLWNGLCFVLGTALINAFIETIVVVKGFKISQWTPAAKVLAIANLITVSSAFMLVLAMINN